MMGHIAPTLNRHSPVASFPQRRPQKQTSKIMASYRGLNAPTRAALANRPKDRADLDTVLPLLAARERSWLASVLGGTTLTTSGWRALINRPSAPRADQGWQVDGARSRAGTGA
jgi:hypothetical protein